MNPTSSRLSWGCVYAQDGRILYSFNPLIVVVIPLPLPPPLRLPSQQVRYLLFAYTSTRIFPSSHRWYCQRSFVVQRPAHAPPIGFEQSLNIPNVRKLLQGSSTKSTTGLSPSAAAQSPYTTSPKTFSGAGSALQYKSIESPSSTGRVLRHQQHRPEFL